MCALLSSDGDTAGQQQMRCRMCLCMLVYVNEMFENLSFEDALIYVGLLMMMNLPFDGGRRDSDLVPLMMDSLSLQL